MRVYVLGSGSSGNCLVVEAEGERVVLDAGIPPVRCVERMRALGSELVTSRAPLGVFVTHEHGDHASRALPMARALRAPLYAHDGVAAARERRRIDVRPYLPGRPVPLGPFVVEALPVPHDAPHVALRVGIAGRRVGYVTDVGHVTRELRRFLAGCDLVLLESNYCPAMLEVGPYPPRLRQRVAGPLGHLSNEQAGELVRSLEDTRVARVLLVHVSRTNNEPARALETVAARARRMPLDVVPHGVPLKFDVAPGPWSLAAEQLSLAFEASC